MGKKCSSRFSLTNVLSCEKWLSIQYSFRVCAYTAGYRYYAAHTHTHTHIHSTYTLQYAPIYIYIYVHRLNILSYYVIHIIYIYIHRYTRTRRVCVCALVYIYYAPALKQRETRDIRKLIGFFFSKRYTMIERYQKISRFQCVGPHSYAFPLG